MGANNINNAQNVNVNQDVTLGNPGQGSGGSTASAPGQLGVDETAGQNMPSGWGGGIHTWDIYANGTLAAGEGGTIGAYVNDMDGSLGGGGSMGTSSPDGANYTVMQSNNSGSQIVTDGLVQSQGGGNYAGLNASNNNNSGGPEIYTNGIIDAGNGVGAGSYFGMFNGSWYAQNNGNTAQSGNLWASGNINTPGFYADNNGNSGTTNTFTANGQVVAGYDARIGTANGTANVGWGCSEYGEIAANASGGGQLMMCNGSSWQMQGSLVPVFSWANPFFQETTVTLGWFNYCAFANYGTSGQGQSGVGIEGGPNASGQYLWYAFTGAGGYSSDELGVECYNLE